ncbi:MAG TPA: hypothetical protein PLM07_18505 [Candidatus Rifleibacterium sp.]|nr:hypothetical protein [Candidatus Rifleibacterium sp.]HPT47875.1 hypothetical protein [Candidatus Rifleibacterium sp.]
MQISEKLQVIAQAYKALAEANRAFSPATSGVEGFRNLIEQRNLVVEDLEVLTTGLLSEIGQTFAGNSFSCNNLSEILMALPVMAPELATDCDLVKSALKELVESDKMVEENVGKLRDDIKAEIGRIRQGARGLRGYKQAETFGSCFINRVK